MIIIPAIDLKEGKCVRLRRGKMDSSTVFNENPTSQALEWESLGADRIHIVDLDGSVEGKPANLSHIRSITRNVRVAIEVGGGIRNLETIEMYLDAGVNTVILGTIAAREPGLALTAIDAFPGRVAIGIDALNGFVAVQGWTESTHMSAAELAAKFDSRSVFGFIYTDIDRDGMMQGPNIQATEEFASAVSSPVILSGGISSMGDIEKALPLWKQGVMGIIVGRALYEGKIDLKKAIEMAKTPKC